MIARHREVEGEVMRLVATHPGAQAAVIIGTLKATRGYWRHEVASAFAYLSNMGFISIDGEFSVWPAEARA